MTLPFKGVGRRRVQCDSSACDITPAGAVPPIFFGAQDAAGKKRENAFLVFAEVNLPPEHPNQPPSWLPEIERTMPGVEKDVDDRVFDTVIVTNLPHQYGLPRQPAPARSYLISIPLKPEARRIPDALVARPEAAIRQYGNIPNEFPKE